MDFVQKKVTWGAWGQSGTSRTFAPDQSLCSREWGEGPGDLFIPSAGGWAMDGPWGFHGETTHKARCHSVHFAGIQGPPWGNRDLLFSQLAGLPSVSILLDSVPLVWRAYFSKGGKKNSLLIPASPMDTGQDSSITLTHL